MRNQVLGRTYDKLGRIKTQSDALGNTFTYAYDNNSNITSILDPMNRTTTREYNSANKVSGISVPADETTYAYSYDGNLNCTQATKTGAGTVSTLSMSYDGSNRLAGIASNLTEDGAASFSYSEALSYDPRGSLTAIEIPGQGASTYTYDAAGNLSTATDTRAPASSFSFTYMKNERLAEAATAGLKTSYDYFENGLAKSIVSKRTATAQEIANFTYDYDRGNMPRARSSYIESNPAASSEAYAYDAAGRLTSDASSVQSRSYAYDASGNMESKTVGDGLSASTTTYAYDAAGRLLGDSQGNTYAYDAAGNLTGVSGGARAATTYTYDAEGRMTGAGVGQETASYTYDALGRMTKREEGGASDLFMLKGTGYEPLSITGSAGPTSYLYTPDGSRVLSSVAPDGKASTLGTDIHLDVVFAADSQGNLTSSTLYSPSGEKVATTGTPGALGYQGDYTDGATGLVSMGLRNYDPSLGRFNTPDPKAPEVADPMSFGTYLYCNDAPLGRVDLMGTNWVTDLISRAANWVYETYIEPIGRYFYYLGRAYVSAAQAVYRTAVNAVKAIARNTRSIGANIGKAMASSARVMRSRAEKRSSSRVSESGSTSPLIAMNERAAYMNAGIFGAQFSSDIEERKAVEDLKKSKKKKVVGKPSILEQVCSALSLVLAIAASVISWIPGVPFKKAGVIFLLALSAGCMEGQLILANGRGAINRYELLALSLVNAAYFGVALHYGISEPIVAARVLTTSAPFEVVGMQVALERSMKKPGTLVAE